MRAIMKKIILILPYFGNFRNDFYFWMKSVEYNNSVDFLIFTDNTLSNIPSNVRVVQCQLEDIENMAIQKLGVVVKLSGRPYKLCDLRPAYGEIFSNYLNGYDYWGHCDSDLIFGNIRSFITNDILDKYERILVRGHLTIYKNTREINGMYRLCQKPYYKEVFQDTTKPYQFDEWNGTTNYWVDNRPDKVFNEIIFDDILSNEYDFHSAQKRKEDIKKKNVMFSFIEGTLYRIYEENEIVKYEETCYVHFQKRHLKICTSVSEKFSMIPNKYIDYVPNVTVSYLRKKIRSGKFWHYYHRAPAYFKRKKSSLLKVLFKFS